MYGRIVVPLDGTPFGDYALPYAVAIARRTGAEIELVHVHRHRKAEPYLAGITPYCYEGEVERERVVDQQGVHEELDWLQDQADSLAQTEGIKVSARVLDGRVDLALQQAAEQLRADLVVMATHGRGGLNRWRFGSVGDALVRHVDFPILLVRPPDHVGPPPSPTIDNVLITLDGSAFSEQILKPACALLGQLNAQVTLVHVVSPLPGPGRRLTRLEYANVEQRCAQAKAYLDGIADRLGEVVQRPTVRTVVDRVPAAAVLDLIAQTHYDMVALATHGRGGLTRLLAGSTADEILQATHTPVFLLRPRPDPAADFEFQDAFMIYGGGVRS